MRKLSLRKFNKKLFPVAIVLLALGVLIVINGYLIPAKSEAAVWYNDNWGFRNNFPLTAVTGASSVYVAVTINTSTLVSAGKMNADCSDIRFTDANGNLLQYFIVSGCNTSSTSIHVLYVSLQGADQTLYFYYGNAQATSRAASSDFSSAATATVGSVATEEKAPSPLAYYKFDEGSSNLTNNSGYITLAKIALVQKQSIQSSTANGTAQTPAFTTNPNAGDTIVVICVSNTNNQTFTASDTTGNSYTSVVNKSNLSSTGTSIGILYSSNILTGSSFKVTCTSSGATDVVTAVAHEYSGVLQTNPADKNTSASGSTASAPCPCAAVNMSVTTNSNNELYITGITDDGSANDTFTTTGTNFIDQDNLPNNATTMPVDVADNVSSGAGSVSQNWTSGTSTMRIAEVMASFKPSSMLGIASNTTWQTEDLCVTGKCLLFNGSNSNVKVANNNTADFVAADNFTVGAWAKFSGSISATKYILTKASAIGTSYTGYKLYMSSSGTFCFDTNDGTHRDSACSLSNYTDNQWHFVEGVREGTSAIRIYIDGILVTSVTSITSTGTLANSGSLYIGADADGASNVWNGFLDEIKIYRDQTIRTTAQVKADFNARGDIIGDNNLSSNNLNNPSAFNNGLVGYWKEDETTNGAAATDSSGLGTSLTDSATVTRAQGKFGNSASLNGSTQYQSAASAANSALDLTGNVTISVWINPSTVSAGSYDIAGKWDGSNTSYLLQQNGSDIRFYIGSSNNYGATSSLGLTTGTWYHVVATYNAAAAKVNIYVNGALKTVSVTGTIPSSITSNAGKFHIGADSSTTTATNFYNGKIDAVRVYSRTLSSADATALFNFAPGPTAYFPMEDGSGTTITDRSTNGNTSGTFAGSGTNFGPGKIGKALNFNGSGYVPMASDISPLKWTTDITIEAWVNPTSVTGTQDIFCKWTGTNTTSSFCLQLNAANAQLVINNGSATTTTTGATTLSTNTWYHLVGVYTAGSSVNLYINGFLDKNNTTSIPSSIGTNTTIADIAAENAGTNKFNGSIDEVKFYNYALTQKQLTQDYNGGHPAPGSPIGTPVGWWKFDEGYGNGTGNAHNSGNCGSSCNGNLTNSPSWSLNGKYGKALTFASASSQYVVMPSDLSQLKITGAITLSAWINMTSHTAQNSIICKWTGAASSSSYCMFIDTAGKLNFEYSSGGTPVNTTITGNTALSNSTWYHVVAVFNPSDNVYLYINGALDKQVATTATSLTNSTTIMEIGADNTGAAGVAANFFNGTLDEPKVYAGTLTASQVAIDMNHNQAQQLANAGSNSSYNTQAANQEYCIPGDTTTCSAPSGRWDFEEKTGQTVNDSSGNGHDGVLGVDSSVGSDDPTWTSGKIGGALLFNGSGQFVNVNNLSSSNFITASAGTLEAWVYFTGTAQSNSTAHSQLPSVIGDSGGYFGITRGNWTGAGTTGDFIWFFNNDSVEEAVGVAYTTNTWYHLAWVHSGGTLYAYVNGVLQGSVASGNTNLLTGTLQFGKGDNLSLTGTEDSPRTFNYARSAAQIAWDYNRGAPVSWYKLDECQGTTINDSSGNGNAGTLNLGASGQTSAGNCTTNASTAWYTGRNGKINASLNLDGIDDYVNIPNASSNQLSTQLSLSAWVNLTSLPSDCNTGVGAIINKGRDATATYSYMLNINGPGCSGGSYQAQLSLYDGTNNPVAVGATSFTTGKWYHVVGTWDGSNMKVYVNGILDNSTGSSPLTSLGTQTSPVVIGKNANASNRYLNGQIDDVRIYNYSLTATQVKQLYNLGSAVRFGPSSGKP